MKPYQNEDISSGKYALKFSAAWCGPCQQLIPIFEGVENIGSYTAFAVDYDTHPHLAAQFKVSSVPTMVYLEDGSEVSRQAGTGQILGHAQQLIHS